ncbi:MAG TPA: hypothetical protein VG897_03030 [Terriglobales bacterium]|nr:hypothetical protein [Terriglobales bacterium]
MAAKFGTPGQLKSLVFAGLPAQVCDTLLQLHYVVFKMAGDKCQMLLTALKQTQFPDTLREQRNLFFDFQNLHTTVAKLLLFPSYFRAFRIIDWHHW